MNGKRKKRKLSFRICMVVLMLFLMSDFIKVSIGNNAIWVIKKSFHSLLCMVIGLLFFIQGANQKRLYRKHLALWYNKNKITLHIYTVICGVSPLSYGIFKLYKLIFFLDDTKYQGPLELTFLNFV